MPRHRDEPAHEPLPFELSETLRRSLAETIARFPANVRARGRRYAEEGRVGEIEILDGCISAIVDGTEEYWAEWEPGPRRWRGLCTCPMGDRCKHLYALALELLAPGARLGSAAAAAAMPPVVERIVAAETPAQAGALMDQLARRAGPFERPLFPALVEAFHERDPELRVWRVARELVDAGAHAIAPDLAAWGEREDLAGRHERRRALDLLTGVEAWVDAAGVAPRKRLRFELCLSDEIRRPRLFARARLTSARLADEVRTGAQLAALLRDAEARPGELAAPERELARFLLEGGFVEALPYEYSNRFAPDDALLARAAASPLVRLAADLDARIAARSGLVPGARVVFDPEPARIVPVVERGAHGPELHMRCLLPDGDVVALDQAWFATGRAHGSWVDDAPRLIAARGRFLRVVEAPPRTLLQRALEVGGVPLGGAELRRLQRSSAAIPELAASLAPLVRALRVTPLLLLDLVDRDAIDVRVIAHTGPSDWGPPGPAPEGARLFEAGDDGAWRELDATFGEGVATDPSAGLEQPDPADLERALRWIDSVEPPAAGEPAGRARHRFIRLSAESLDRLSDAFEAARRDALGVYASARLARLLRGGPRLRVSVRPSGIDFFEVDATWDEELAALSDDDRARLRASEQTFVRLRGGWVRRAQAIEEEELLGAIADLGVAPGDGARRVGMIELAAARSESLASVERLAGDAAALEQARALRERVASFKGVPHVARPAGLRAELRPYQHAGLDFLAYLSSLGLGALLADDMGLGKTVQALAWLLHLREREPEGGTSLVVCPTSVMHGWAREAARFAPELRVRVLERGSERAAQRSELAQCDLAITSYALLRRDIAEWRAQPLRAVILDEAQQVKNPDAVVARAVRELRARHRLVLTGTPLENRPLDLWSLCEFANPGFLGERRAFLSRFDRPGAPPHTRRLLAARLRPILLRRLKRDVAPELPERIEERRDCELSPEQRKRYAVELERARRVAAQAADSAQAAARKRIAILAALLRLRQIACHPALAGGSPGQRSGKLDALLELVEPLVAEGHKVLVFSQFVRFLELVRPALEQRAIRSHVLTGATAKRDAIISAFQADPDPGVFLISLKAGGSGLNLTAARYVVLLDPWWNPAVEAQAIDRTHRIGQDRTVIAYRLVARGTVEEKVLALQQAKQALVQDVLGDEAFARSLSREDLEELFAG